MPSSLLLISVGNTRTRFAAASGGKLEPSKVAANDDLPVLAQTLRGAFPADLENAPAALIASVNDPVADQLETLLGRMGVGVSRFGRDVPIPILNALADDSTVGQDRLLDALGAFARSGQACIVIDAGTAVTVDFVDGEGVFQGGAIAPGLGMMFTALHEHTAALPLVSIQPALMGAAGAGHPPREEAGDETTDAKSATPASSTIPASPTIPATAATPFGKDTRSAIALGVAASVRGMVHHLVDQYAEYYEAYPRVIATGGDAPLLFEHDPIVETIVPDLTLIGMLAAVQKLEELDGNEEE